jgi:hypothetical protein
MHCEVELSLERLLMIRGFMMLLNSFDLEEMHGQLLKPPESFGGNGDDAAAMWRTSAPSSWPVSS